MLTSLHFASVAQEQTCQLHEANLRCMLCCTVKLDQSIAWLQAIPLDSFLGCWTASPRHSGGKASQLSTMVLVQTLLALGPGM